MACSPEQARLNAQKSTGPRTARGKAIASRNARKHGLTSSQAPLLASENVVEFRQLFQSLLDRYQPSDAIEQHLCEKIAMAIHRQRRLWSAEVAPETPAKPSDEELKLLAQRERWQYLHERLHRYSDSASSRRSKYFAEDWANFCRQSYRICEQLAKLPRPETDCDREDPYGYKHSTDSIAQHRYSKSRAWYTLRSLSQRLEWQYDEYYDSIADDEDDAAEIEARERFALITQTLLESVKSKTGSVPATLTEAASPPTPTPLEPYKPTADTVRSIDADIAKLKSQIESELVMLDDKIARVREKSADRDNSAALTKVIERGDLVARYERHLSRELREAIKQLEAS